MAKTEENKRVGRKIVEGAKRGLTSGAARAYKAGSAYLGSGATIGELLRAYGEAMSPIQQAEYTALTGEKLYPPKLQPARWNNATRNYETIDPNQPTISTAPKNYRAGMYEPKVGPQPIISPEGVGEFAFDPLNLIGGGTTKAAATGAKYLARGAERLVPHISNLAEKYAVHNANIKIPAGLRSQAGIVKLPNGNWLSGGDGVSLLDANLSPFDSPFGGNAGTKPFDDKFSAMLSKYIKNDMASENDIIRKLADQDITHYQPLFILRTNRMKKQAADAGLSDWNVANTSAGRKWENWADDSIETRKAGDLIGEEQSGSGELHEDVYSWLNKVPPETPVHDLRSPNSYTDLGFDHMRDALREKWNAGEITPEQLRNLNMEKAVRMTHAYDLAAAEKMAIAKHEGRHGLTKVRDYPDYEWVQLSKPGDFARESDSMGHSVRGYEPQTGHPDWSEASGDRGHPGYGLGGWEAIKSGDAKVFSLQNKKTKEPHVTVEVGTVANEDAGPDFYELNEHLINSNPDLMEEHQTINDSARDAAQYVSQASELIRAYNLIPIQVPKAVDEVPQYMINQIKGKQNAKPIDQYLPYVQDLVKNPLHGEHWTEVKDLENSGLFKAGTDEAYVKFARDHNINPMDLRDFHLSRPEGSSPYYTEKEFRDFINMQNTPPIEKAGGGIVKAVNKGVRGLAEKYKLAHEEAQKNAVEMLGLPPDNTAMDRARAMGKTLKAYIGRGTDYSELNPAHPKAHRKGAGNWATLDPEVANTYAGRNGGNVMQILVDPKDFAHVDFKGNNWQMLPSGSKIKNADGSIVDPGDYFLDPNAEYFPGLSKKKYFSTNDLGNVARKEGNKGLIVHNVQDQGGYVSGVNPENIPESYTNLTVFDPKTVRSVNAAFDPAHADSADLLKAHGGLIHSEFNFDEINHYAEGGIVAHNDFNYAEIDALAQGFAKGGPVLSVGRGEKLPVAQGAGLTAKGRAKYNSATGSNLKAPAPHPKTEKEANRRKSFCARMSGMPGPMKDENGNPTRKAASLKRWNC